MSFGHRGQTFNFFSAVTVLGTPQDITLQELRVECFFPMDDATGAAARTLVDAAERDLDDDDLGTTTSRSNLGALLPRMLLAVGGLRSAGVAATARTRDEFTPSACLNDPGAG